MSEERNEVHIKTYDEWLKYYKNATKEQVIEDLTRDVQYFADAVKDIKDLQQKVEQLEEMKKENKKLNNIINELEEYIKFEIPEEEFVNSEWYVNILDKLKELKESNNDKK